MPATLTGELASLITWLNDPTRQIVAHLAKNFIPSNADSIALTDLVEADFPGYSPFRIADWKPNDLGEPLYGEGLGLVEWSASDDIAMPQSLCVAYLTIQEGTDPAKLWWPIPFPKPAVIAHPGETFGFEFRVSSADLTDVLPAPTEV